MRKGVSAHSGSRRLFSTVRALCSHQSPMVEAHCGNGGRDDFEFSVKLKDVAGKKKIRIDSFLSEQLPDVSRARLKASIQEGRVTVNSVPQKKPAYGCKIGDLIVGTLPEPPGTTAEPEEIPLSVTYEDEHVLVVNKAAGMVVHPSPGHYSGTLVNAILHHYSLPAISLEQQAARRSADCSDGDSTGLDEVQEVDMDCDLYDHDSVSDGNHPVPFVSGPGTPAHTEASGAAVHSSTAEHSGRQARGDAPAQPSTAEGTVTVAATHELPQNGNAAVLRPGIVHRLDKGTTGLMVVCRSPVAMLRLGEQFRARSINRLYYSITVGVPDRSSGEICTNIDRHPTDRLRMAVHGFGSIRGRQAISTYRVLDTIGNDTAALVEWKLHTGRTHQIRVHAEHIGCPLFGDKQYDGVHRAMSKIGRGNKQREIVLGELLSTLDRPALHAKTLGFMHPVSGQQLSFDSDLPADFESALEGIRSLPAY